MTDYLDMVQRKSAVDQAMEVWKERRSVEWKRQDDNWEKEYDERILTEQREADAENARWESLTEEQQQAELDDIESLAFDSDSDDDSDDDWSDEENDDVDLTFMEEETKTLTPEEKKAKEWDDYKRESKEWRERRTNEVWNAMLYCSWPQLRRYRSELGLSNEDFMADTFL
tara:strand:+ start:113 stop:625 length:513 start_codon:yes stop_codon:yes gene_type:complete